VLQQPEAPVGHAEKRFDGCGELTNGSTRDFLVQYLDAFGAWVQTNARERGRRQ